MLTDVKLVILKYVSVNGAL